MSYNSSTKTITAPVSISDVQSALSNSSGDLATLCTSGNINMWSRHKPTNQHEASILAVTDSVTKSNWWVGLQRNTAAGYLERYNIRVYGYHPTNGDNMNALFQGTSHFSYVAPSGATDFRTGWPYRLDDFEGYVQSYTYPNINSTVPIKADVYTDEQYWGGKVSYNLLFGFSYDSNVLTLRDVFNTNNMHIGMLFVVNDSSDSLAGSSGYTFRLVSCSTAFSSMQPGKKYSDTNISVYMVDGYTYNVEVTLNTTAFKSSWIGKNINVMPVFTTATFNYGTTGDSSAYVYGMILNATIASAMRKSFTLLRTNSITTAYKRPNVEVTSVNSITKSGTTIYCPGFTLTATSNGGYNQTGYYNIQISSVRTMVQRYISSADTTVYYTNKEGNLSAGRTFQLYYVEGRTTSTQITDGPSCVASGYETKRQLVINVNLRCQKGSTSEYDTWGIIKVVDID